MDEATLGRHHRAYTYLHRTADYGRRCGGSFYALTPEQRLTAAIVASWAAALNADGQPGAHHRRTIRCAPQAATPAVDLVAWVSTGRLRCRGSRSCGRLNNLWNSASRPCRRSPARRRSPPARLPWYARSAGDGKARTASNDEANSLDRDYSFPYRSFCQCN